MSRSSHLRYTPHSKTMTGPGGIVLEIDVEDSATPALVWDSKKRLYSATYDCAVATGELDCGEGPELTDAQVRWLDGYQTMVDEAINFARKDDPAYG